MRRSIPLILAACLIGTSGLARGDTRTLAIEDVAGLVSAQNLTVLSNAQRVYQAKDSIRVARGNLLPKLNVWRIAGAAFDPTALFGMVEDIVPFLVPANWLRVKEAKLFAEAQREAYTALWANELMTAKGLYIHAELDRALLELIERQIVELQDLKTIARSREVLGDAPELLSKQIAIQISSLKDDVRALRFLLKEEVNSLGFALGLPSDSDIILMPLNLEGLNGTTQPEESEFVARSVTASPEIRQYLSLIEASKHVRREAQFSFLGISTLSRGVMGGVFDSLPISDGLGFGTAASIRISKRQKAILELQQKGIEESLRRTAALTLASMKLDLDGLANAAERRTLAQSLKRDLKTRLQLGAPVEAALILAGIQDMLEADSSELTIQHGILISLDRVSRLTFVGDYANPPGTE